MVGSGAVGIGFAADGGRVASVWTWSTPPGTHHRGGLGGAWGSVLSCHFLSKFEMISKYIIFGLPWWLSGKESTCSAGDMGSVPGLGIAHVPQNI